MGHRENITTTLVMGTRNQGIFRVRVPIRYNIDHMIDSVKMATTVEIVNALLASGKYHTLLSLVKGFRNGVV